MSADVIGAMVAIALLALCGLLVVWIGRAGTEHRFDWSWGHHTAENTPPNSWELAHVQAGPKMEHAGWAIIASGLIGGPLLLINVAAGLVALLGLVAASLVLMAQSIAAGLRILADGG